MEGEWFFSGYCRCLDASRMVEVEQSGEDIDIDCSYAACPHAPVCEIAKKIRQIVEGPASL